MEKNIFLGRIVNPDSIELLKENKIIANKNKKWFEGLKNGDIALISVKNQESKVDRIVRIDNIENIGEDEVCNFTVLKQIKPIKNSLVLACKYFNLDKESLVNASNIGSGFFKLTINPEFSEIQEEIDILKIDFEKSYRTIYVTKNIEKIPDKKDGDIFILVDAINNVEAKNNEDYKLKNIFEYNNGNLEPFDLLKKFENININKYTFNEACKINEENGHRDKARQVLKVMKELKEKEYYRHPVEEKNLGEFYQKVLLVGEEKKKEKKNDGKNRIEEQKNENSRENKTEGQKIESQDIKAETEEFLNFCKKEKCYYEERLVRRFLMSLETKKFLILTGISGTGKTKIAELWADYLKQKGIGDKKFVSVGSNWNDNKKLIGFENILFKKDEVERYSEGLITETLKEANKTENFGKKYIIILDEMNLSYIERYFSDFLSALESKNNAIILPDGTAVEWKDNIKVIGTVNVDETTYMFSPKVLDRANVIEMNAIKPSEYIEKIKGYKDYYKKLEKINKKWFNKYKNILDDLFIATKNGFAYRTIDEMTKYIELNANLFYTEVKDLNTYLDEQIAQRIIPKLHGNGAEIKEILYDIKGAIEENEEDFSLINKKIKEMENLDSNVYVSGIGN